MTTRIIRRVSQVVPRFSGRFCGPGRPKYVESNLQIKKDLIWEVYPIEDATRLHCEALALLYCAGNDLLGVHNSLWIFSEPVETTIETGARHFLAAIFIPIAWICGCVFYTFIAFSTVIAVVRVTLEWAESVSISFLENE